MFPELHGVRDEHLPQRPLRHPPGPPARLLFAHFTLSLVIFWSISFVGVSNLPDFAVINYSFQLENFLHRE